jgi:uncharacterized protein (TIGR00299 family) protein
MSRTLYVDAIGGAAGDMLLAGLIDAGAPLQAVRAVVEKVLPGRFRIDTEVVRRGGLRARRLRIDASGEAPMTPRPFGDLVSRLDGADLPPRIRDRARAILDRLGGAEALVHGIDLSELSLHELGDDDTLLDVVGVVAALEALEVTRVFVSVLPLGAGRAAEGRHAHGDVPLPATVTVELLRGFAVRGAGEEETVTPTAAAIFAELGTPVARFPDMTIEEVGCGAGTRESAEGPNIVRLVVGPPGRPEAVAGPDARERELSLLEANLDDLTPELVSDAARALLDGGALDVWSTPVQMKKGRPGIVLSALCEPEEEASLRRIYFETTSTFGVRVSSVRRTELERRIMTVSLEEGSVRVKVGLLDGGLVTATPEHDDVAALAARTGRPVRSVYEEAVATARALRHVHSED